MNPRRLVPIVLIAAFVGFLFLTSPKGFSTDLTRIGEWPVTVVATHDLNLVASVQMMDTLGRLKSDYGDRVGFLVADLNRPEGKAFAARHDAGPVTLLLFDVTSAPISRVSGAGEGMARAAIETALEGGVGE